MNRNGKCGSNKEGGNWKVHPLKYFLRIKNIDMLTNMTNILAMILTIEDFHIIALHNSSVCMYY